MNKLQFTTSIIIPNWNGRKLLEKHLPGVLKACQGAEIIIADDASTDDSVTFIKENYPDIVVIQNPVQRGFASNVNTGVIFAKGEIIILLNTDIEPRKDLLQPLLQHFTDPKVFAVGCLDESHEKNGIVRRGRGIAYWEKGFLVHSAGTLDKTDTAWVSGGSGAFRKEIWQKLGGMDTIFNPFYWEDIDISFRALKAGYRILFESKSIVEHFHDEGKIKTKFSAQNITIIAFRNQCLFFWKNVSDSRMIVEHCFWLPVRIWQEFTRGNTSLLLGFLAAFVKIPSCIMSRSSASRMWKRKDIEIFSRV